ncbi:MAG: peptidoglycan-associated lipoprotein Pal [Alphaproteobacteria bacterium]|nr:peptidoglycan-associated lipoprotein Pal [Alphaproteobacteria bacterium]
MRKGIISLFAISMLVAGCSGIQKSETTFKDRDSRAITGTPYNGARYNRPDGSFITPGTAEEFAAMQNRIFFGFDQSTLDTEGVNALKSQSQWLNFYPSKKVVIEGHADERGTREYNLALGERRANSVKDYLVSKGVSANRIKTISYGKERPAVAGSNSAAWAKNRRAVTVVAN